MISHYSAAPYSKASSQSLLSPPLFGRIGTSPLSIVDTLSVGMQAVATNPLYELTLSDLMGMVGPRSYIELRERGFDMFRETLIREASGTVSNVFLTGWVGALLVAATHSGLMNNTLFRTNMAGISPKAWIPSKTLDYFGQAFEEALQSSTSPQEARAKFLNTVFSRLQTSDNRQGLFILKQSKSLIDQAASNLGAFEEAVKTGKLSQQSIKTLINQYGHADDVEAPVFNLHKKLAEKRVQILESADFKSQVDSLVKTKPQWLVDGAKLMVNGDSDAALRQFAEDFVLDKHLAPERMALTKETIAKSQALFSGKAKDAEKSILANLLDTGLSDVVHLLDEKGNIAVGNRGLGGVLKEVKFFLEQYADRVLQNTQTGDLLTDNDVITKYGNFENFKQAVSHKLYGNHKTGWFKNFIAHKADGLITFTQKMKTSLIATTMLLTVALGASIAFLNNLLTRRKHHGENFFPGEKALEAKINGVPQQYKKQSFQQNPFVQQNQQLRHVNNMSYGGEVR